MQAKVLFYFKIFIWSYIVNLKYCSIFGFHHLTLMPYVMNPNSLLNH